MKVELRTIGLSADHAGPIRQLEAVFGAELARRAAAQPPFAKFGLLRIHPATYHPAARVQAKPRSRYERSLNTCFSDAVVDYPALVSEDWKARIDGYAAAIRAAVQTVAKARMDMTERARLLDIIDETAAVIGSQTPDQLCAAKPVYVKLTADGQWAGMSFVGPLEGMVEIRPEDCLRLPRRDPPAEQGPSAFKLYRGRAGARSYHEAWPGEGVVLEHWGPCGDRGEVREHPAGTDREVRRVLAALRTAARKSGFKPIPPSRHAGLAIEYSMAPAEPDGSAAPDRTELEEGLDQLIGWLGLGHCDGGSTGAGTLEVFLEVVDFECARAALMRELAGGPYAHFSRIYRSR